MRIVVTVKQVSDPDFPPAQIALDASGRRINAPLNVPLVMNGYDANALEAALQLKEQHGGKITALSVGDESCRQVLKRAVGMGADDAVLLGDESWQFADSAGVGAVIAAAIKKIGMPDLVLCGRQASDSDGGQTLYWIARELGIPVVTPVSKIESVEDGSVVVRRLAGDSVQRLRVKLPALLGISSEINEPREPTFKGIAIANRMRAPRWNAVDIAVALPASRVEPRSVRIVESTSRAELAQGETGAERGRALAERLHAEGLL